MMKPFSRYVLIVRVDTPSNAAASFTEMYSERVIELPFSKGAREAWPAPPLPMNMLFGQ